MTNAQTREPQPFTPPSQSAYITKNGRVVGHIALGGPMLLMPVREKTVLFEMHNYFGPIPTSKRTQEQLERIPKGFWDSYERWHLGGKLVDGELCVVPEWCEPCHGTGSALKHLGGRHYQVEGVCQVCGGARVTKLPVEEPEAATLLKSEGEG